MRIKQFSLQIEISIFVYFVMNAIRKYYPDVYYYIGFISQLFFAFGSMALFWYIYYFNKTMTTCIIEKKAFPDFIVKQYEGWVPAHEPKDMEYTGAVSLAFVFIWALFMVLLILSEGSTFLKFF